MEQITRFQCKLCGKWFEELEHGYCSSCTGNAVAKLQAELKKAIKEQDTRLIDSCNRQLRIMMEIDTPQTESADMPLFEGLKI